MSSSNNALDTMNAPALKACCANLYQREWTRLLLGESFHPGGTALTEYLGTYLALSPQKLVLDVASGPGTSAIRLAQRFGCRVLGLDYSDGLVSQAGARAVAEGVAHLVSFQQGDAECLPFPDATFDAVLCECAFCTFPNKTLAAAEWQRVLKPGGRVGLSDLTRSGDVPPDLQGLLAWLACIASALPVEHYVQYLTAASLDVSRVEPYDEALGELVHEIEGKLLAAEVLMKLKQIELAPSMDFAQAKALAKAAKAAIRTHQFGYVAIVASKPEA
jgi:arsenite methyltransferase